MPSVGDWPHWPGRVHHRMFLCTTSEPATGMGNTVRVTQVPCGALRALSCSCIDRIISRWEETEKRHGAGDGWGGSYRNLHGKYSDTTKIHTTYIQWIQRSLHPPSLMQHLSIGCLVLTVEGSWVMGRWASRCCLHFFMCFCHYLQINSKKKK